MRALVALLALLASPVSDQPRDLPVRGMVRQAVRGSPRAGTPAPGYLYWFTGGQTDVGYGGGVAAWNNLGSLGDAAQTDALRKPVRMGAFVSFDGAYDVMTITGSDTGLAYMHTTGVFDVFLRVRKHRVQSAGAGYVEELLLSNNNAVTDKGMNIYFTQSNKLKVILNSGVNVVVATSTWAVPQGQWVTLHVRGTGTQIKMSKDLVSYETTNFTGALGAGNATREFAIGCRRNGASLDMYANIDVHDVVIYNSNLSTAGVTQVKSALGGYAPSGTGVAILGDSNSIVANRYNNPWPMQLQILLGDSYWVANYAISGDTASAQRTDWTTFVRGGSEHFVVQMLGTNDVVTPVSAGDGALAWADINSTQDEALADGGKTVLVTAPPFKTYVGWSAQGQTEIDSLNTSLLADADAGSASVDTYTSLEGAADTLAAAYDNGDHVHLTTAGGAVIAAAVKAAIDSL